MGKRSQSAKCLFLDIGGVILTDGWNHHARKRAVAHFALNHTEMEERHHHIFETFEEGKNTLDEYLSHVVFYKKRPFTRAQFRKFMFAQSQPCPGMLDLMTELKAKYHLKVIVVSNEGRELNHYRIEHFKLGRLVDAFISSCYVQMRKPDPGIFELALDVAQVPPRQIVYVENTELFVGIAKNYGIRSILHQDFASTREKLASYGLRS